MQAALAVMVVMEVLPEANLETQATLRGLLFIVMVAAPMITAGHPARLEMAVLLVITLTPAIGGAGGMVVMVQLHSAEVAEAALVTRGMEIQVVAPAPEGLAEVMAAPAQPLVGLER